MVGITELAAQKVKGILKEQNKENAYLRIYIAGQGCCGPNFGMTLDESKTEDDFLDEEHGISILTDIKLANLLEGAIIDLVVSETGEGFEIRRAKIDNGEGCGGSCGGCSGSC